MNTTITLREYLNKHKNFIIPYYQRGYVWGKTSSNNQTDSATYMMQSLLKGFVERQSSIFIQGVTVSEMEESIVLVDGQQRTTFFYLLLKSLGYQDHFVINYEVREESQKFLQSSERLGDFNTLPEDTEEYQDIYFFKKSLYIIKSRIKEVQDPGLFLDYILDNVKFLYIDIPKERATIVFSMMNGNRAEMKPEELIKAELLRLASLSSPDPNTGSDEHLSREWECNMLRSRYAREWDKWLQWWNKKEVQNLYMVHNVMGLLVLTLHQSMGFKDLSFEGFCEGFLKRQHPKEAKDTFDRLRRLQKRFEDAFNTPRIYNCIGAILRIREKGDKKEFIKWYFLGEKPRQDELERYYFLAFLDVTHKEIIENNEKAIHDKYQEKREELEDNYLYLNKPEVAFQLLLRLNIDEDNLQEDGWGRNFDFSIWDRTDSRGRSLEHIYPKSKVYHTYKDVDREQLVNGNNEELTNSDIDDSYIRREDCVYDGVTASEHSIGNLVLLYKDDNSSFSNSSFEEKKALFFKKLNNKKMKEVFKSRHLLHSIYKFSNSEWKGSDIAQNKLQVLKEFDTTYERYISLNHVQE